MLTQKVTLSNNKDAKEKALESLKEIRAKHTDDEFLTSDDYKKELLEHLDEKYDY